MGPVFCVFGWQRGMIVPIVLDGNKFYLRDETETYLAVRDEIVALVRESIDLA